MTSWPSPMPPSGGPPPLHPGPDTPCRPRHDAGARPGKREHRYGVIVGYDQAMSQRTNLVSDLVLRQSQSPGKVESIVEFGFRHAPVKDTVLGAALGWGVSEDAPRYRVLFSVQQGF